MSEVDRYASEFLGSSSGAVAPDNPPDEPSNPTAGGPAPPGGSPLKVVRRMLAAGVAVALLGMGGALYLHTASTSSGAMLSAGAPIAAVPQAAGGVSGGAQAIAALVGPAVVDINTVFQTASGSGQAAGTGIILTSTGEILTNNHVVEGATSITVQIAGRTGSYTAHVLGVDPTADVALIQVDGATGLPTATIADSSTLQPGEAVVAIGNAGGVGGTPSVSQGTIVALGQSITASGGTSTERLTGMIQSSASIAPGDSGGPLVNSAGQVVGMITAGQGGSRSGVTTIGFAIPTNSALAIVNQIRAGQSSSEVILGQVGFLGIGVTDLTPAIAAQLGLNATSGALVTGVVSGSPAAQVGLSRYALITEVAGSPIASAADLGNALHSHKPGDQVQVTWTDTAGASHSATATLTTGPAL
jgi:S1-C subfamily serine protease